MIAQSRWLRIAAGAALALTLETCSEPTAGRSAVLKITFNVHSVAVTRGDSVIVFASGEDAQGNSVFRPPLTWTTRDSAIAVVDPPAWIIGRHAGRTVVAARSGTGRDSVFVLVILPRTTLVTPSVDTLTAFGAFVDLGAAVSDSAGPVQGAFTWTSRSPSVADVTQAGRVTGRGDGSTYVVALEVLGSRDSALVLVRRPAARIIVTPGQYSVPLQRRLAFSATVLDRDSVPLPNVGVKWSSSNSALATVDSVGAATAVGVGVDTIRAVGDGITGISVFTIRALPRLRLNIDTIYTGVGLDLTDFGRPLPRITPDPADSGKNLTASVTLSDTSVASAPSTVSLTCCGATAWTGVVGKRLGTTQLTVAAPDYLPASLTVRVTTPRLTASQAPGRDTVAVGGGGGAHFVISDSLGDVRRVIRQTVVQVRSSDTTVLQALPDSAVVALQDVQGSTSLYAHALGTVRVSFGAPGYLPDSAFFHVVPGRLHFVATNQTPRHAQTLAVATDNADDPVHISTGVTLVDTVRVTLTQRHPERVSVPASVLIPNNTIALVGLAPGADTVIATAPGYGPDTLSILVTPTTFLVQTLPLADQVTAFHRLSLFVADTFTVLHFPASGTVVARVVSSDTTVLRFSQDTASIARSTGGSNDRPIVYLIGSGTATVTVTDLAGQFVPTVIGPISVSAKPLAMAARGPRPGEKAVDLGMRQRLGFPDDFALVGFVGYGLPSPGSPVPIHLRSTSPRVAVPALQDLPTAVLGNGQTTFDIIAGDSVGSSWIVAEGRGLIADSVLVTTGRPHFAIPGSLEGLETGHGMLEIQINDQDGNLRLADEPVPVALSSTNSAIVVADSEQVTIPAGAYHTFITVHFLSYGTAAIRATDPRALPQRYDGAASGPITVHPIPFP